MNSFWSWETTATKVEIIRFHFTREVPVVEYFSEAISEKYIYELPFSHYLPVNAVRRNSFITKAFV
jgi:hypothetical protein